MTADPTDPPRRKNRRLLDGLGSPSTQRSLVFFTGLVLTVHEAFGNGIERPSLYVLFAGMMGFPLVDIYARRRDDPEERQ